MRYACLAGLLAGLGCSDGGSGGGPSAETKASWALVLKIDGAELRLPLERMLVFLVEDEDEDPELYEIVGPGVALVGEFPRDVHIGYDEDWSRVFGKTVSVQTRGGDPREPKDAHVVLPDGTRAAVLGGALTPERLTGKWAGLEGDRTLHGRVSLRLETPGGEKTAEGVFAVHAVSLG